MGELPQPADVLPHRPPFLFVDEVTALVPGESATGTWRLTGEEWFFAGHFPGRPTLPGVLMCEAIAQVGAIAVLTDERFAGKLPLFGGLDGARFRRQVGPGDELTLEVTLGRMSARAGKGSGRALLGGDVACSCELLFVVVDAVASIRVLGDRGARPSTPMAANTRMGHAGDEDHGAVVAAEAEVVGHRRARLPVAGVAGDDVDAEVDDLGVRRRRDLAVVERQQHRRRLQRAGGTEGVTGHALDRRRSAAARRPNTSSAASASAASFNGVDVPWALIWRMSPGSRPASSSARRMHADAPTPPGDGAVMWWASALLAAPSDLADDRRPAPDGMLPLLEHEHGRALAEHEPVAVDVERAAHARRRQRGHVAEPGLRRDRRR